MCRIFSRSDVFPSEMFFWIKKNCEDAVGARELIEKFSDVIARVVAITNASVFLWRFTSSLLARRVFSITHMWDQQGPCR